MCLSLFPFSPFSLLMIFTLWLSAILYFFTSVPVLFIMCASSRLTSRTLVSRLLIISAAPTEGAALCLTSMI